MVFEDDTAATQYTVRLEAGDSGGVVGKRKPDTGIGEPGIMLGSVFADETAMGRGPPEESH
ncbi:MAG TPA: hypothetical protein DDY91_22520 [Planctomycetaceae bacterium]|nr:hypothetical protein [Planctomycetaceae bacterium]